MLMDEECRACIVNQSTKVANAIGADESLRQKLRTAVEHLSESFSPQETPPEIASYVYAQMAEIANKDDLYDQIKSISTIKALSFLPMLHSRLQNASNPLLAATKIAVAGNVIDLAAAVEFDLEEELLKIFERSFEYDDFIAFTAALKNAKSIVVLGDNAGEHIFDKLFIQKIQELYPKTALSYFVRGVPIINDVTMKEAREAGFEEICELVDSGVDTPGFAYNRANRYAQELFDKADLIISKGMGNYESLTPSHRKNICFLLKVKCNVVARSLKREVGDIICKFVE